MASISKRPDGRYRVRWREFPGAPERSKHFDRKVDAQRFADSVAGDLVRGAYVDPKAGRETVEQYARRWMAGQVWRDSSRDRVEHVVRCRIVPRFGRMPLQAVRRSDVQGWVASMTDDLKPATVESYYRVLAAIMRSAVRDKMLASTPCDDISLPRRGGKAALVPLGVEQVHAIADAVPLNYRALIIAQAGLGLRQGEACGLTVDRVDFLRRTVTIDRQLITPNVGDVELGPVKTDASNRVIPLPSTVADALAAHLSQFPVTGDPAFVFTSSTGAPIRRSTYSDAFRRAARDSGVKASSHDLRHHCASLLIRSGLSVKAVQRYLGHATAGETLDTYGHLWPDDDDRIRTAVDSAFMATSVVCERGIS